MSSDPPQPSVGSALDLDAAQYPLLSKLFRDLEVEGMYVARRQVAPAAFQAFSEKAERFPAVAFVSALAFELGLDRQGLLDGSVAGCGQHEARRAIAGDGTLCPSVIAPGKPLNASQAQRLADAVSEPDPEHTIHLRSVPVPTVAFVFFDATGKPVGEIAAERDGGLWMSQPAVAHAPTAIATSGSRVVKELCSELELHGCTGRRTENADAWQAERERLLAAVAPSDRWRLGPRLGLPPGRLLRHLSTEEKRLACAWHVQRLSAGDIWGTAGAPGLSYECRDRTTVTTLSLLECEAAFPQCEVTVSAAEQCVRVSHDDPCGLTERGKTCTALRGCTWGATRQD